MIRRRSFMDRKLDGSLALMLGLLVISRCGTSTEIQGYLLTLQTRAAQGAAMGSC